MQVGKDLTFEGNATMQHTEVLLRKQEESKVALKEKFVAVYEAFFQVNLPMYRNLCSQGQDPSQDSPNFWEELLLLKV